MKELRRVLIGVASAMTWPIYILLLSYAAWAAPWPRDLAWPACMVLLSLSGSLLVANAGRMACRRDGWAEEVLLAPKAVTRQLRRVAVTIGVAGFVLLMPVFLVSEGLIAPGGRPIVASALGRMLVLGFELVCWVLAYRLLRKTSPLLNWLDEEPSRLGWAGRHRRTIVPAILTALGFLLGLEAAGYRFSARRMTMGGLLTIALAVACWGVYRLLLRVIEKEAWRWKKAEEEPTTTTLEATPAAEDDNSGKLRTLAKVLVGLLGAFGLSTIWNVDLALFDYLSKQRLWGLAPSEVNVGDFFKMTVIVVVTAGAWRYLNTFFTLAVFPRMPDDPGIRYAVATLCRYMVLAIGLLSALSTIHLGIERIGVVLAALGVGLGFGLQEIVSNFVSGIILLLERPIRVGDTVSVGEMIGKVDRINIRATTIINGDNQSMIIPNRQFITGNVVNWTHKDKIMRVAIKVNVERGTDAEKVTDLLLSIAHADPDVLNNPVPSALLDAIGDVSMQFVLHAFVPEPSLMGRVKHRLYGEVQRRFESAGIVMPWPTQELRVLSLNPDAREQVGSQIRYRRDDAEVVPAPPRVPARLPLPVPEENCYRGVDE